MNPRALLFSLCLLAAEPAAAEVELQGVRWELVRRENPRKPPVVTPIETLELTGRPIKGRLIARLQYLNRGPASEGLLIRYSLRAKLAPADKPEAAAWSVPFMIEEKRVPRVVANQKAETALDPTAMLNIHLKRLERSGYYPQELKLEATVSPRRGESYPIKVLEVLLPVKR